MKKNILYLLLLCHVIIFFKTTIAQTNSRESSKKIPNKGLITGTVIDSASFLPIKYACFQLFWKDDTSHVLIAETKADGKFILKDIPLGSYSAHITALSYKKRKRDFIVLTEKVKVIDLDTIRLAARSIYINEVVVSAKSEGVFNDNEKIIVRVNRDLGNNGIEILENIPLVNVDIDGNVNLAGKENTKIYIDGIPLDMAGFQKPEELRHLSVTDIEKVEIITSHSIEYIDAGNTGIINIVTRRKLDNMFTGNVAAGVNTRNSFNVDANLSYFYKTLIVRGSHSFNNSESRASRNIFKSIKLNDSIGYLEQTSDNQNDFTNNSSRISVVHNPDTDNSFTAGIVYNNKATKNLLNLLTNQSNISESFGTTDKNIKQNFLMLLANYRKTFSKKNEYLNLRLNYNHNKMSTASNRSYDYLSSVDPILENDFSNNLNNTLNWSTRYATPLRDNITVAMGYSGSLTELDMRNDFYYYDQVLGEYVNDASGNNHYKNGNVKHSLSGYVNSEIINIDLMAGINYEFFITKFDEYLLGHSFQKKYSNLFPEISMRMPIDKKQSINLRWDLNYTYPMNRQINPYTDYSDSTNITVGNPNLEPSLNNRFTADYILIIENTMINAGCHYIIHNKGIEEITEQNNLTTAITTYKNIYNAKSFGFLLSANTKLFDFLTIGPWLRWSYRKYTGGTIKSGGSSWSLYLNMYTSFKDFRFQINSYYSTPVYSAQTKTVANYYVDVAMRVLLFDRSLSLTIKAKDIFNMLSKNTTSLGYGFSSVNGIKEKTQIFFLDISYYFNIKAKEDIEERKDTEEYSDDF